MPVSIPLQANALTTLDRVLLELDLTADGDRRDSLLHAIINAASDQIAEHCSRVFHRADAIVENVAGDGETYLQVRRPPILDIVTVAINGTVITDFTEDAEDQRRGLIYRAAGWPWEAQNAGGLDQGPVRGTEKKNVAVTYNGGFVTRAQAADGGAFDGETVTLPGSIEDACVELVTSRWRTRGVDTRVMSETHEATARTFVSGGLPYSVQAKLANFKRIAHG